MKRTALEIPCTEMLLDGTSITVRVLGPADSPAVAQLARNLNEQDVISGFSPRIRRTSMLGHRA